MAAKNSAAVSISSAFPLGAISASPCSSPPVPPVMLSALRRVRTRALSSLSLASLGKFPVARAISRDFHTQLVASLTARSHRPRPAPRSLSPGQAGGANVVLVVERAFAAGTFAWPFRHRPSTRVSEPFTRPPSLLSLRCAHMHDDVMVTMVTNNASVGRLACSAFSRL